MRYAAKDIARWFLEYNAKIMIDGDSDHISNLKLQKLLYYAQGSCLAITDKKLFDDPIVAWRHGPVVESVYREYKNNGSCMITEYEPLDREIDGEIEAILCEVYEVFGQYSAWKLRNMTHDESPWKNTELNDEIPPEDIKEFFKAEYIA